MKKISIYLFVLLVSNIYPQCNENNQLQCIDDDECEWFEDVSYGNCSNLAWQVCESYIGCYVDSNPGWYDNSGPYCTGGTYPIDDSYCLEIEMPECSDMNQLECSDENSCDWVVTYQWYDCNNFSNSNQCNNYSEYGCYWDSHWYYSGWSDCDGPSFQLETGGFCQELEMPECNEEYEFQCTDGTCIPILRVCNNINDCEDGSDEIDCEDCSELIESNCSNDVSCEWIEDIEIGNCSDINNGSECYQTNQCFWYSAGNYGYMYDNCYGGTYEVDNSYCDEIMYFTGDINQDNIINIQDVIIVINLILTGEFDLVADLNLDSTVNVLDVIQIVNVILNN